MPDAPAAAQLVAVRAHAAQRTTATGHAVGEAKPIAQCNARHQWGCEGSMHRLPLCGWLFSLFVVQLVGEVSKCPPPIQKHHYISSENVVDDAGSRGWDRRTPRLEEIVVE